MPAAIETLSAREKETLRLLLGGHDAKSIARDLDLSVHTVNDRLREARRKLGVSSSREAARLLGRAEQADPNFSVAKNFGVASAAFGGQPNERPGKRENAGLDLTWLGGGMLVLSLIVAAVMLVSRGGEPPLILSASTNPAPGSTQAASMGEAREWLALIDHQNWAESWRRAGTMFRSQVSQDKWAATILPVRQPMGNVVVRSFSKVTKATSLPGAPDGEYELLEFRTDFAGRRGAIETLVLMKEKSAWKVVGYFIR